ncbi:MAG: excinuclease ABC subunit UvrC, partial [Bacteroidales bacterium]|nr:excinuclease ABC subunit UvrC [Bacteroidales bacterium]
VMLKDDKTYPWICITKEDFPRVFYTRNKNDIDEFYGPYASVYTIKTLISLIKSLYQIRTCRLKLSEKKIAEGRFDVCLEYHIGNCKASCVGLQTKQDYAKGIDGARKIISGKLTEAKQYLQEEMKQFAQELQFEKAQQMKEKIATIENYQAKSSVVSNKIKNVGVYGVADDVSAVYISYFKVLDGAIVHSFNTEIKKRLNETPSEILLQFLFEIWNRSEKNTPEAILPFLPEFAIQGLKYTVPKRGEKFELLSLAQRNARFYMLEKHKISEKKDPEKAIERKLNTLMKDLNLKSLPRLIECFDNSNLQGTNPVASCVVFRNSRPAKKEYRHYNIKTVEGSDDYASMREIIFRRYKRQLEEKLELPQLIIIDGGKGQLSAALQSLQVLYLDKKIAVIGIAERLEQIYFPNDSIPLYLDKNSESLKLIRHVRDEAHRFALSFHKKKRSASFINSELEQIKGIGEKTIVNLLKHFKSLDNIKNANYDDLAKLIGKSRANIIVEYFSNQ